MNRKFNEIDSTLRGLNHSTDAHFKWLVTILRFVSSRDIELAEITQEDAHDHCEFGQWLNVQLQQEREDRHFLLDINIKHNRVHQACRQILNTIENDEGRSGAFDAFEAALLEFTESISLYKQHLLQLRTSYDALTGLPLRRILDESFDRLNEGADGAGLYLLLLDIDHFKKVNDNYGHLTGDAVLRSLALNLEDNVRRSESVYRYGGEELIILLRAESDREATAAAERLRHIIAAVETVSGEHVIRITFTSGLTRVHRGEPLREVLERADMALYRGKHGGRNCTILIGKNLDCINVSH
ncbi:Diguanylate cyclase YdeH [compost metagenome]